VPPFASQSGELVDDDEAGSDSLGRDAHQIEQDPGADLRRQRWVGWRVEAEEHRLAGTNCVLQRQSGTKVLASDPFDDEPEACSKPATPSRSNWPSPWT
jgi:hypothetical protein